ncbi:MAG: hypothetical protein R2749_18670 [Acidimicrobiales bacterium]
MIDGRVTTETATALSALNLTLRDDYAADCQKGIDRWNRLLAPIGRQLLLPPCRLQPQGRPVPRPPRHPRRPLGGYPPPPGGQPRRLAAQRGGPGARGLADGPGSEPGRMAGWLAAPASSINGRPLDFEYVRA